MDKLMNAAKASSFEPTIPNYKESKINAMRFKRIIAQVYIQTCDMFKGMTMDDATEKIGELMNDSSFILSVSKKGITCDVITIKEALKWTAKYVITGEKENFYLVAAFDAETVVKEPELRTKNVELWTAAVLSSTGSAMSSTDAATGYDTFVCGTNVHYEIVNKSMRPYEMIFKED